ncbi:MAG TPA: winged helix DNA-binding domain-containing protein [Candidatus Limnocylindrales bacterium]|nr:winged helix DNA-binding domain-containing protein [Candidatus Limnocylindrales bacterium]
MGGLQTQAAPSGYVGLWSRLAGFERASLTRALEAREVVQGTVMRATIHTVSAADYWPMTIGVRRSRRAWTERTWRKEFAGVDMGRLAEAARDELMAGPLRMPELVRRLAARGFPAWPVRFVGHWLDLVRVPPSGTWERRRADLYGLADAWLPRPDGGLDEAAGIDLLVRRHLGAFGPAAPREIAGWAGLPVSLVRPAVDRLGLRPYEAEDGLALYDLSDRSLADPDAPAPVRFLAVWDPILLVHLRRTQVLPEALRPLLFNTRTPQSANAFLVDGQVAGSWRFEDDRIAMMFFRDVIPLERRELEAEAERLGAFHRD